MSLLYELKKKLNYFFYIFVAEKIEPLISKLFLCKDDEILKASLDSTECLIGKPKTKFEKIPEKKKSNYYICFCVYVFVLIRNPFL